MEAKKRLAASSSRYLTTMTMTQTMNNLNKIQVIGMFVRTHRAVVTVKIKTSEEEVAAVEGTTSTRINLTTTSRLEVEVVHHKTQIIPNKKAETHGAAILIKTTWLDRGILIRLAVQMAVNHPRIISNTQIITTNMKQLHLCQTPIKDFKIIKNDILAILTTMEISKVSTTSPIT
jgi:hypothetical protein